MLTTMRLLVSVALALWAPRLTTAQECTPENGRSTYNITSASQARSLFSDCDTIIADAVSIDDWNDDDSNGTFSLAGITNITGTLICNHDTARTNMSRLEMPDLQYLGGLQTNGRSFERGVYFEQLRSIAGKLDILSRGAGAGASISFPKMEDAGEVSVDAGGAVINLESLQTVQGDLNLTDVAAAPLPALQSAGYIRIDGRLSYISLPDLKTAGAGRRPPTTTTTGARDDLSTGSGIYIDQYLSGIALEIPRLTYVEGDVEIRGAIIDLALPSLESVTGALYLSVRTSVGLPALRSAAEIGLFEVRGDASIPHLNPTNTTLLISSLPCSSFGAGLRDSPEYAERCAQYEEEKLSTGAKAAVGVVVPLVVLGIFLAILACHKRRVRRGEKAVGMVVGDVEMVDLPSTRGSGRDDGGDGDGDIERGRIPVTQPGRMESERSPTPPPPYEPRRE